MENKVKIPAIGLIVLGVLGALLQLSSIFMGEIDVQQLVDAGLKQEQAETIAKYAARGGPVLSIVGMLISLFIAWAGLQMTKLRSWMACVIANVMVMIPCFTSCCCVLGLPIGIWGLIVLFNADVKRAFVGGAHPPAGETVV